jgi:NDP-sugar pyrophosphorylase family protein
MSDILAGFVLAAGAGTRLRPLSNVRAKALCPVGNTPLVDLALDRVGRAVPLGPQAVAVNLHHHGEQLAAHLDGRVHLSWEPGHARGTAGALGHARDWIDGRDVLAVNADAWSPSDLTAFVDGWDRTRVRLLLAGSDVLEPDSRIVASLMPGDVVRDFSPEPAGLYEACWRDAAAQGRVEVVRDDAPFVDCGTPADYLRANLLASGGESVVDPAAEVEGEVVRSVVWDTGRVAAGERLVDAIRIGFRLTVLVR